MEVRSFLHHPSVSKRASEKFVWEKITVFRSFMRCNSWTRSYFFSKFLVFRRFELWISKIRIFPDWSIYYSLWKGHLPIVFLSRYDAGSPWIPAWTTCSSGSSRPARRVIGRAALREHCTAAYIFRIKEWFTMQLSQLKKNTGVFPHGSHKLKMLGLLCSNWELRRQVLHTCMHSNNKSWNNKKAVKF